VGIASKQELLARGGKRRFDEVTLGDGTLVRIRSLTREDQRNIRKAIQKKDGSEDPNKRNFFADVMLAMSIVGEDDQPIFTVDDALKGIFDAWDTTDATQLVTAVYALNGASEVSPEDAAKN